MSEQRTDIPPSYKNIKRCFLQQFLPGEIFFTRDIDIDIYQISISIEASLFFI